MNDHLDNKRSFKKATITDYMDEEDFVRFT